MSFITNAPNAKTLEARLTELLTYSQELSFLVGFFYFSGYSALYSPLRKAFEQNPELRLRVLVGLAVDTALGELVERERKERRLTNGEMVEGYLRELQQALSHPRMDFPEFPEQARFFLELLQAGHLELRKTRDPVHAKLYLFGVKPDLLGLLPGGGSFISGSSNLTHGGLSGQREFNVEIRDYGFDEARDFFDKLWRDALPLSPKDIQRVARIVERGSLAAQPTPLEVYALLLRRYLDTLDARPAREGPRAFLERAGYTPHRYQLDAVEQLLHILEEHGGAILADVVGLGKTVVASLTGREWGQRGLVIAPPHLIGAVGEYGWADYLERFGLYDWRVYSTGKLEEALRFVEGPGKDVGLVVVDEAHRFRNPETLDYALLSAITRGRKALLLTATPINNRPLDAYALLRLFVQPRKSTVGPSQNLEDYFLDLDRRFRKASYALRYRESGDLAKRRRAEFYYQELTGDSLPVKPDRVRTVLEGLARDTRLAIAPVMVRRNRKDLLEDPRYRTEAPPFPVVKPPVPLFYELTPEQSDFYDRFLKRMGPEGEFKGALYQPEFYRLNKDEFEEGLSEEEAFALSSQRNLADFMRRLLVRRFESSLGAFVLTLERVVGYHRQLLEFARQQGVYLLDRKALDRLLQELEEGLYGEEGLDQRIEHLIQEEQQALASGKRTRQRYYRREEFGLGWDALLKDVESDLKLLEEFQQEVNDLDLADPAADPKAAALAGFLQERLRAEPARKVVVFSEFTDTIAHLEKALEPHDIPLLAVGKNYSPALVEEVVRNFDASVQAPHQRDDYRVLLASDRLSEGISLHRAGMVVNYDIPWNPTRLIQRLGRVNRIGQKPFEEVYLHHFFPSMRGAGVSDPRAVAEHKLFLIHKALGEDAQILSPEEEPTPARIYERLTHLPDEEEAGLETWARQEWERLVYRHPDLPEQVRELPNRLKVAMPGRATQALLVARKGVAFFALRERPASKEVGYLFLPEVFELFKEVEDAPWREPSEWFMGAYKRLTGRLEREAPPAMNSNSLEVRALQNVRTALRDSALGEEEKALLRLLEKDLQYDRLLPRYVVRRLQEVDVGRKENLEAFRRVLREIQQRFGVLLEQVEAEPPVVDLLVGVEVVQEDSGDGPAPT